MSIASPTTALASDNVDLRKENKDLTYFIVKKSSRMYIRDPKAISRTQRNSDQCFIQRVDREGDASLEIEFTVPSV